MVTAATTVIIFIYLIIFRFLASLLHKQAIHILSNLKNRQIIVAQQRKAEPIYSSFAKDAAALALGSGDELEPPDGSRLEEEEELTSAPVGSAARDEDLERLEDDFGSEAAVGVAADGMEERDFGAGAAEASSSSNRTPFFGVAALAGGSPPLVLLLAIISCISSFCLACLVLSSENCFSPFMIAFNSDNSSVVGWGVPDESDGGERLVIFAGAERLDEPPSPVLAEFFAIIIFISSFCLARLLLSSESCLSPFMMAFNSARSSAVGLGMDELEDEDELSLEPPLLGDSPDSGILLTFWPSPRDM